MLLVLAPLVGFGFIEAVSLFAQASESAIDFPELARGMTPLDGILVPTLGAFYLAVTLLFPFVAIRTIGQDRQSGAAMLASQFPVGVPTLLAVKALAAGFAWGLALAPALSAIVIWTLLGGHWYGPEVLNLLLGHALYAFAVTGIAFFAAALADSAATAAIVALAFTLGFWVLDFAATGTRTGWSQELSHISPTAALREFERGLFSLPQALELFIIGTTLIAAAGAWLTAWRPLRRKIGLGIGMAMLLAALLAAAGQARVYRDLSEDRRNSFSPADEAALARMDKELVITLYLAPDDSRLRELEANMLARLGRSLSHLRIRYANVGKAGLFGPSGDDRYGLIITSMTASVTQAVPTLRARFCLSCMDWPALPRRARIRCAIPAIRWSPMPAHGAPGSILACPRSRQHCGGAFAMHSVQPSTRSDNMTLKILVRRLALASAVFASLPVQAGKEITFDFSNETVGAEPAVFAAAVGNWIIARDGENVVLEVNGAKWSRGQPSAGLADKARALYGERYAEFLDNVKAYAYFPLAVNKEIADFHEGEIGLRFKGITGRIDQAAGVVFNLKPNGDYLVLRANCLENNLVLFKYEHGKRSSVKWVRNVPTPSKQWHDLKLEVRDKNVRGYLDGKLYLEHTLPQPASGRVGVWSKADSVVYFDDFRVALP